MKRSTLLSAGLSMRGAIAVVALQRETVDDARERARATSIALRSGPSHRAGRGPWLAGAVCVGPSQVATLGPHLVAGACRMKMIGHRAGKRR